MSTSHASIDPTANRRENSCTRREPTAGARTSTHACVYNEHSDGAIGTAVARHDVRSSELDVTTKRLGCRRPSE